MEPIVVVHGGTGAPPEWADGCEVAAEAGRAAMRHGSDALEAVVVAMRVMEDDGRFDAGRGSFVRLDGETVEMDAGLMDSSGRLGAVAALRGYRHPIDAARAAIDTPHVLYAGEGAARLAARAGLAERSEPPPDSIIERHARVIEMLRERTSRRPAWRDADLADVWNFPTPIPEELRPRDTVGAVARDETGLLAAANSTGGALPMLLGRVGDGPLAGAGFWAGPHGAVATTGVGEEIIRRLPAFETHRLLGTGADLREILLEQVAAFPEVVAFGLIALSADDHAFAANRTLPIGVAI